MWAVLGRRLYALAATVVSQKLPKQGGQVHHFYTFLNHSRHVIDTLKNKLAYGFTHNQNSNMPPSKNTNFVATIIIRVFEL